MWNPFKKKDPMKEIAGVHHLAESFFPMLVTITKRISLRISNRGKRCLQKNLPIKISDSNKSKL